jgi:hypothetical protein
MAEFLSAEDFSDKGIEILIESFSVFLSIKKVKIVKYKKNSDNFRGEDPNFCCYFFKIEGKPDLKKLSIVFDKNNKKVNIRINNEVDNKTTEITKFESIESFRDNFLYLSKQLH